MPARLKLPVSHPLIVAYLALFVALGGTAFAAASITGRDIANGSLTGADLRNGSIRSPDVKGITGNDLGPGAEWTLRSPDKRFSLAVTDDGIKMKGPDAVLTLNAASIVVDGGSSVDVLSTGRTRLRGALTVLGGSSACAPLVDMSHVHSTGQDSQPTGPATGGLPTILGCR